MASFAAALRERHEGSRRVAPMPRATAAAAGRAALVVRRRWHRVARDRDRWLVHASQSRRAAPAAAAQPPTIEVDGEPAASRSSLAARSIRASIPTASASSTTASRRRLRDHGRRSRDQRAQAADHDTRLGLRVRAVARRDAGRVRPRGPRRSHAAARAASTAVHPPRDLGAIVGYPAWSTDGALLVGDCAATSFGATSRPATRPCSARCPPARGCITSSRSRTPASRSCGGRRVTPTRRRSASSIAPVTCA